MSHASLVETDDTMVRAATDSRRALGAARRGLSCRGCGQRLDDIAPLDAIAVTRVLERRWTTLLHRREGASHVGPARPGSRSAMEPAMHVSDVLATANSRLRELFGEDTLGPLPAAGPITRRWEPANVRASFAENVRRLTTTIDGATAEDWYRARPDSGATAAQLVWLALHDATHHLEDVEILLDAALSTDGSPRAGLPSRLAML